MARTNIDLDDRLIAAGMKMTGCRTKKELVNLALEALIARKTRKKILELEGKIDWTGDLHETRKTRV
jgi:Arc/MetJ family transcription regulator